MEKNNTVTDTDLFNDIDSFVIFVCLYFYFFNFFDRIAAHGVFFMVDKQNSMLNDSS